MNTKLSNSSSFWMFLIGLGSRTQFHFFGSLGISELPIFILAPFVFMRDFNKIRSCGFMPWLTLSLCVCVGCLISGFVNDTPLFFLIKGFATPYSIFAIGVIFFHFMYKDLMSFRWFIVGTFLSSIICVFIFQPETYLTSNTGLIEGEAAVMRVVSYPLFWAREISELLTIPVDGWYLNVPSTYSWIIPLIMGFLFIIISDSSGRSAFLVSICASCIIFLGGRSRLKMRKFGKNFIYFVMLGVIGIIALKSIYSAMAISGMLGEKSIEKYEKQTSSGKGLLNLLMSGRKEFFISLIAAKDRPIVGFGPRAEDTKGYAESFLLKYGSEEDIQNYFTLIKNRTARIGDWYRVIPTHSYIGAFWVYYGIIGLLFWLYILMLIWKYFRTYLTAIPHFFGYLSISFPGMLWDIFFSPYGNRFGSVLPIVCVLFARAVAKRRIILPYRMINEIEMIEKKCL